MAEPIGLALGVAGLLPVVVEVLEAFKAIRAGIKTARKCVKEIKEIELPLDVQRVRFHNECVLLLRQSGEDDNETKAMLAHLLHPKWRDEKVEHRLFRCLDQSYGTCRRIIENLQGVQEQLLTELHCFDVVRRKRVKGESINTTFRRMKAAIQFVFDKSTFEKGLENLRRGVNDLRSLRKQLNELNRSTSCTSRCSSRKSMPRHFSEIQEISCEAYSAMVASFSCADNSHDQHCAAVCLDAKVSEDIHLDMAITYTRQLPNGMEHERPVRFLLQSKAIERTENWISTDFVDPLSSSNAKPRQDKAPQSEMACTNSPITVSASYISGPKSNKRKQKVMFTEEQESASNSRPIKIPIINNHTNIDMSTGPSINLCAIQSACDYLREKCESSAQTKTCSCIAFFQKPRLSKYIFYISTSPLATRHCITETADKRTITMQDFLRLEQEELVTHTHQLKLALKLSLAILQYHSTPWLEPEWRLSQLMLLTTPTQPPEDFALYLCSRLPTAGLAPDSCYNAQKVQMAEGRSSLTQAQKRGIYNTTLFCLGVTLLEIGYWKSLNDLREDYDLDDIETARRLGNSHTTLGKLYDTIILKCLQCNFGFGTDLTRPELQSAVYSEVVCPLEDLIKQLEGITI